MTIYPSGVIVFVVFCVLLTLALSSSTGIAIGSAVATVCIALSIAGFFSPNLLRKNRGL